MKLFKGRKGLTLNQVPAAVMLLVLIGLLAGAGALSLSKFSDTLTAGSTAKLAVDNATKSIGNAAEQLPTVF